MFHSIKLPIMIRLAVTLVALSIALFICCKSKELTTVWAPGPIQVDGNADDWSGIVLNTVGDKDNSARVGLANDSTNLYLLVRFTDRRWAGMIRMSGLTIQLTPKGLEAPYFQITYRDGPDPSKLAPPDSTDRRRPGDRDMERMENFRFANREFDSSRIFTCMVHDRIVEMPIPPDGINGPAAAFGMSRGVFTYEFKIPLQKSIVRYYGLDAFPGQEIALVAEWGGFDRSDMPGRERGGFEGGPGGGIDIGMGPPVGGMGGHPPGGPTMSRPKKQEIKAHAVLALSSGTR